MPRKAQTPTTRKATPKKLDKEVLTAFQMLLDKNMENLQSWLDRIAEKDPAKAFSLLQGLSEYVLPKQGKAGAVREGKEKSRPRKVEIEIIHTYPKEEL